MEKNCEKKARKSIFLRCFAKKNSNRIVDFLCECQYFYQFSAVFRPFLNVFRPKIVKNDTKVQKIH
jgi:hypothetical protein